ncbi:MAG: CBS domain-containing protein [Alphaproteobacteria bacterium]|nr:CBS domain-containing protein [Alphaproteobacteria bacterium]MBT5859765.1 CBS domain-containing protein [Alphaproteobacteria bacterium]
MKDICIQESAGVRDAITAIERGAPKIALVVDSDGHLVGTVTDGDVRRGFLSGIGVDNPVVQVMNKTPATASHKDRTATILARMSEEGFRQMPVVDDQRRVVGIETLANLQQDQTRDNVVVLMAGGLGERLQPLTDDRPKPLLEVGNKPILESTLESFVDSGFRHFFLSVNYKREMVEAHFGDGSRWGVTIEYLREDQPLGTAGALGLLPETQTDPVVVMNGDILTKVDFDHLLNYHAEHGAFATVGVREYDLAVPYGVVEVEGHRLTGIREKPVFPVLVNAGIYVFDPEAIFLIPKAERCDIPQLIDAILANKKEISVFPIREYWIDIGQKDDLARAKGDFSTVFR